MENLTAVQILYQAASQAHLTAQDHQQVAQAAQQLQEHFNEKSKKK